jgi:uncharacterized protein DUF6883
MTLPNAERAVVAIGKLRDYCLNSEHRRGRHKARVFAAVFGLTAEDAEELRQAVLQAARTYDAAAADDDEYGQRYVLDFPLTGVPGGRRSVPVGSSAPTRTYHD